MTTSNDEARRVAIVTGAASGMGRAACERLAGKGWGVVAGDVDGERLAWTDGHDRIVPCAATVATPEGNESIVATAVERFGRLDALVLNAGISRSSRLAHFDVAVLDELYAVNVRGTVLGIQAGLPALRAVGGGAIVVTASIHGLGGDLGYWAYSATKHALVGVVRSLARDLGPENIRINAVCPTATRTGMSAALEAAEPETFERIRAMVPLQRWAEPDEMAAAMEFLVSPEASFVNGVALPVDGGVLAGTGLQPPAGVTMAPV